VICPPRAAISRPSDCPPADPKVAADAVLKYVNTRSERRTAPPSQTPAGAPVLAQGHKKPMSPRAWAVEGNPGGLAASLHHDHALAGQALRHLIGSFDDTHE
jgi:hypothetical protein